MTVPILYTLAQVAEKLHVSPRRLKEHPEARLLGRRLGRQVLFTEADVLQMIASLPSNAPSIFLNEIPPKKRRANPYVADDSLAEALRLATEKVPRIKPRR